MNRLPASSRDWVAAATLVGFALVFVGFAVPRSVEGGIEVLTLPLALLAADLLIAAALLTGWYPIRPVAQGLAIFGVLVHALVVLRSGPIWIRGCAAVLAGAHVYGLVLLFVLTASEDQDELDGEWDEIDESEADVRGGTDSHTGDEPGSTAEAESAAIKPAGPESAEPAPDEPAPDEFETATEYPVETPVSEVADVGAAVDGPGDDKERTA